MAEEMTATENETGLGVEDASEGDVNLDLQDRMSDGAEDAWYSSSNGTMFDGEGNEVIHPTTGQPFRSQAEYDKFVVDSRVQNAEAKKQDAQPAQPKPMSRSFDSIVAGPQGKIDAGKLFELAKANEAYNYKNELVPLVDATLQQSAAKEAEKSPIQQAQDYRQERIDSIVQPMVALRDALRDALVAEGADVNLATQLVSRIADETYKKQLSSVETDYQKRHTEAIEKMAELKAKSVTDPLEKDRLQAKSMSNIERLSKSYYPQGGTDAFFSLVNGHSDEKGTFQRGAASAVVDFVMSAVADGKKFSNEGERNEFYANQFQKMTADPIRAQALFDLAHNYWLGKNIKSAYASGKNIGLQEAKNAQKYVKQRPTSAQNGVAQDEDESLGPMMRSFLKR